VRLRSTVSTASPAFAGDVRPGGALVASWTRRGFELQSRMRDGMMMGV
jgi:hypothetical protein